MELVASLEDGTMLVQPAVDKSKNPITIDQIDGSKFQSVSAIIQSLQEFVLWWPWLPPVHSYLTLFFGRWF